MLFHITATHEPTNCSAHSPKRNATFAQMMQSASEKGVTLKGAYVDAPGHAIYILAEADDALALARLLQPVLPYGHYDIHPVVEAAALMKILTE